MTFEAVDCVPLGPKFPSSLTGTGVDDLVAMALAPDAYRPRRRWFRRQRIDARLRLHQSAGLLSEPDAQGAGRIGPQPRHQMAFRPRGRHRSQRSV